MEISKEQISLERSVSNTGRGKQREGEIKNGFSVVPGSYDQSKTYDAGKHETDRYYDELVDARIPLSSRNPDIDQLAANKSRLILLNKTDMADERVTAQWEEYFKEKRFYVARTNARSGKGVKGTQAIVMDACKEKLERDRKRGIKNRPIRAMIAGIQTLENQHLSTVWLEKPVQKQEINQELQKENSGSN